MGSVPSGPLGTITNSPVIDSGTICRGQSHPPGPTCSTREPGVLAKASYVLQAWELACTPDYARPAIIHHTEEEFYTLAKGTLPGVVAAIGVVIGFTGGGALIAALVSGGGGAGVGAVAGFSLGVFALVSLGLGFMALDVAAYGGDMGLKMWTGAQIAWDSRGGGSIEFAAREMADAIGIFYGAVLVGIVSTFAAAGAARGAAKGVGTLRKSTFFKHSPAIEAWLSKHWHRLIERYTQRSGSDRSGGKVINWLAIERWEAIVAKADFRPRRNKGMLWSKVGEQNARQFAHQHGFETLELWMDRTGLMRMYKDEFGVLQNEEARRIWELLSRKYARSLEGQVIARVDYDKLHSSIRSAKVNTFPQISAELDEISEVMAQNPKISSVELWDHATNQFKSVMSREVVLQSYELYRRGILH